MLVFRKIWRALFSWNTHFENRPFAYYWRFASAYLPNLLMHLGEYAAQPNYSILFISNYWVPRIRACSSLTLSVTKTGTFLKLKLLLKSYFTMSSILSIVYVREKFQLTILQFLLTKFLKVTAAAVLIIEDALSRVSNCSNKIP